MIAWLCSKWCEVIHVHDHVLAWSGGTYRVRCLLCGRESTGIAIRSRASAR